MTGAILAKTSIAAEQSLRSSSGNCPQNARESDRITSQRTPSVAMDCGRPTTRLPEFASFSVGVELRLAPVCTGRLDQHSVGRASFWLFRKVVDRAAADLDHLHL